MLDLILCETETRPAPETAGAPAAPAPPPGGPAPRDLSNVVFSVVFCEEARRDYERRRGD